eukprot:TRINITY_DN1427_c3_g1_i1.p1 TRINITY_DN1427_c3_g1~~TRINITY_DN1427_c3_g1_i1.p1  ORF type:complete len:797 (+),score=276.09 TRINITY_DN1427_c3_g1_i1:62-2392(+)
MADAQSPLALYQLSCDRFRCRKNAHLMKHLPAEKGRFDLLTEIDLNLTLVGRKGIRAILELVRACRNVERLCFADNALNNDSVKDIVGVLWDHPSVEHLDLSRNPISHAAGKLLSELAGKNQMIGGILLSDTLINPALIKIIESKAAVNAAARHPKPPAPPMAIPTPPAAPAREASGREIAGGSSGPRPQPAHVGADVTVPPKAAASGEGGTVLGMLVGVAERTEAPQTGLPEWWGIRCVHAMHPGTEPQLADPPRLPDGAGLLLCLDSNGGPGCIAVVLGLLEDDYPHRSAVPSVSVCGSYRPDGAGLRASVEAAGGKRLPSLSAVISMFVEECEAFPEPPVQLEASKGCLGLQAPGAGLRFVSQNAPAEFDTSHFSMMVELLDEPPEEAPTDAAARRRSSMARRVLELGLEGSCRRALRIAVASDGRVLEYTRDGVFVSFVTEMTFDVASRRLALDRFTAPRARDAVQLSRDGELDPGLLVSLSRFADLAGVPHALDCFTAASGELLRLCDGADGCQLFVDGVGGIVVESCVYDERSQAVKFSAANPRESLTFELPDVGLDSALGVIRDAVQMEVAEGRLRSRSSIHIGGAVPGGPGHAIRILALQGSTPELRMLVGVIAEEEKESGAAELCRRQSGLSEEQQLQPSSALSVLRTSGGDAKGLEPLYFLWSAIVGVDERQQPHAAPASGPDDPPKGDPAPTGRPASGTVAGRLSLVAAADESADMANLNLLVRAAEADEIVRTSALAVLYSAADIDSFTGLCVLRDAARPDSSA